MGNDYDEIVPMAEFGAKIRMTDVLRDPSDLDAAIKGAEMLIDRRTDSDKQADALMFADNRQRRFTEEDLSDIRKKARRLGVSARRQTESLLADMFRFKDHRQ